MATNQFLPFGTGANADVLNYADYSALGFRSTGFGTGTAISTQLNTVWRQGAMGAHVLAQFTADLLNADVPDNGVSYLPSYKAAIRSQALNYAVAGGTANTLAITLSPAPASLAELIGMPIRVVPPTTNAGPATLNVNGLGAVNILGPGAATLRPGDLPAGIPREMIYVGWAFILSTTVARPPTSIQVYQAPGSYNFAVPAGIYTLFAKVVGGGGGGGAAVATAGGTAAGSGGGGGGWVEAAIPCVPGATVTVVVGAGGNGGIVTGSNPTNGGGGQTSSFAGLLTATGGAGGVSVYNTLAAAGGGGGEGFGGVSRNGISGSVPSLIGSVPLGGPGGSANGGSISFFGGVGAGGPAGIGVGGGGSGAAGQNGNGGSGGPGQAGSVEIRW